MKHLKKNSNRYVITTTTTIFILAIIIAAASSVATTTAPAAASATTTLPVSSSSSAGGLELSAQPVYEEVSRQIGENLINDTHVEATFAASGNLTLPNATEPIRTTSRGSILISFVDATATGEQVISTTEGGEGGRETAIAKFFGIARLEQEESGRSIVIATVHTNSTGILAPLNGMILAGYAEFDPEGTTTTTLWEWQSGIPLLPPQPSNTTTTTTANTTTTAEGGETVEEEAVRGAQVAE